MQFGLVQDNLELTRLEEASTSRNPRLRAKLADIRTRERERKITDESVSEPRNDFFPSRRRRRCRCRFPLFPIAIAGNPTRRLHTHACRVPTDRRQTPRREARFGEISDVEAVSGMQNGDSDWRRQWKRTARCLA